MVHFRMVIESRERSARGDRNSVDGAVKVSMLNLVDLAGSERIAHTGSFFIVFYFTLFNPLCMLLFEF